MFIWKVVFFISVWKSASSVTSTTEDYSKLNNTSASALDLVPGTTLDSSFSKTAYSCEHNVLHLSCVESGVIHIIRANYGRSVRDLCNDDGKVVWSGERCASSESLKIMPQRCENKERCSVSASNSVFGDPCVGTIKYLEVQYICVSPSSVTSTTEDYSKLNNTSASVLGSVPDITLDSGFSKTAYSCEHNVLHLGCLKSGVIHIIRANYGRSVRDLCNDDGQVVWSGEPCASSESLKIMSQRCENKERCSIAASNSVFGDPCIGTIKYLEVQYICAPPSDVTGTTEDLSKLNRTPISVSDTTLGSSPFKTVYSCEHNVLHIDCVEGSIIHIIRANYGRLTRSMCNDDGQVVWSGEQCMADRSYLITTERCEKMERCSVTASNSIFGDPCVGTIKYLEVQYICVSPTNASSATEESQNINNTSASVPDNTLDNILLKTVCEHNVLHIGCVEGSVIHIMGANYGRLTRSMCNDDGQVVWSGEQCMADRSYLITTERCEQKKICSISASNSVFGDPCVGTIKYLEVQYICVSPSNVLSTTEVSQNLNNTSASVPDNTLGNILLKTVCEHNVIHLDCLEGSVIQIIRANYGRLTRNICNDDGKVRWSGDNCTSVGSFFIMAMSCEDKQKCSVSASNHVFGDPCYGTIKYLEVEYVCHTPINFTSTTDRSTISTSSTPLDPGSKKVITSSLPYYLLLKNYINLNIYYNQEQRKNKETQSEADDSDFVPKWDNCNKPSCLNDNLSEDESLKNAIDSVLPQNSNLSPAPQNLPIIVNADGIQIFNLDDMMKENEIGNDKYVLVPDPKSTPPRLMERGQKETTDKLIEKKKKFSSKRCEDVIKHAKHYLQHLKSTKVEDVEEAYGHYISESLRSIVDPKDREMARIELQKVLMNYRFAKEPE